MHLCLNLTSWAIGRATELKGPFPIPEPLKHLKVSYVPNYFFNEILLNETFNSSNQGCKFVDYEYTTQNIFNKCLPKLVLAKFSI